MHVGLRIVRHFGTDRRWLLQMAGSLLFCAGLWALSVTVGAWPRQHAACIAGWDAYWRGSLQGAERVEALRAGCNGTRTTVEGWLLDRELRDAAAPPKPGAAAGRS
jgi:hypothetical protein